MNQYIIDLSLSLWTFAGITLFSAVLTQDGEPVEWINFPWGQPWGDISRQTKPQMPLLEEGTSPCDTLGESLRL